LQRAIRQRGVPGSLPNNWIAALATDASGRLWIGTNGGGVAWRDPMTGRFVRLRPVAGQPSVSSDEKVRALHLDHNGHLGSRHAPPDWWNSMPPQGACVVSNTLTQTARR